MFGACEIPCWKGLFNFLIFTMSALLCRGVILYAMVCGRLPFGDDAKVKSTSQRQLIFHRPLTVGM